jgi:hypothetical protein
VKKGTIMLLLRLAVLTVALYLALPAAMPGEVRAAASAGALQAQTGKTTQTEYVVGFKKGVLPPFNKVVLATFPPGTQWSVINAFVAKEKKTGLYSSILVTPVLPPG